MRDSLKANNVEYCNDDTPREHNVTLFSLATLNNCLRTSPETNFRLISKFNWSKNNFGEIHISQGLDWALPYLFHYSLLIALHYLLRTHERR